MRERGLRRDKHDDKSLRHGRDRYIGYMFNNEWYQPMPFFYTAEGNVNYGMLGNYRGAHAFLILNGPSFSKLDHSKLKNVFTFGVNNCPKTFRPNAWACVDDPSRFLKSIYLDPTIMKFMPLDHTEKFLWNNVLRSEDWGPLYMEEDGNNVNATPRMCPNIQYYRRNEKFEASRFLWEYTINWGDHSKWGGGRTVMLPALKILFLLGFRKVYLLGCDLNMDGKNKYHFNIERDHGAIKSNNVTYKKMTELYFPKLKPHFDKAGFKVYNCNKDSNLKTFPYKSFDDAIKEATSALDLEEETSWGMYRKFEEKERMLNVDKKDISNGTFLEKERKKN